MCQGWLDILTIGHISANTKSEKAETRLSDTTIYSYLEAEDVLVLLVQASDYLIRYLNIGNFEGASGANTTVIMRLQVVSDMLLICKRATSADQRSALQDLFTQAQTKSSMRADIQQVFDNLISWLFLSGRLDEEEKELVPLGNTSNTTSATSLAK